MIFKLLQLIPFLQLFQLFQLLKGKLDPPPSWPPLNPPPGGDSGAVVEGMSGVLAGGRAAASGAGGRGVVKAQEGARSEPKFNNFLSPQNQRITTSLAVS